MKTLIQICPQCGSDNIDIDFKTYDTFASATCQNCEHDFEVNLYSEGRDAANTLQMALKTVEGREAIKSALIELLQEDDGDYIHAILEALKRAGTG